MKRRWGLIILAFISMNFFAQDAGNTATTAESSEVVVSETLGNFLDEDLLSSLDINKVGITQSIENIKLIFATIKKDIDELQQIAHAPTGPIAQAKNIINTIYNVKKDVAQASRIRAATTMLKAIDTLITQIDQFQMALLLKPIRKALLSFASLFKQIVDLHNYAGKLGPLLLSTVIVSHINKVVVDLDLLAANLTDIIAGGKRPLKGLRSQIINTLISNWSSLSPLDEQLSSFEAEGRMATFLASASKISNTITSLVSVADDVPMRLKKIVEEKKKGGVIIESDVNVIELKNKVLQLRLYLDTLLTNASTIIGSVADIVDIIVNSIILGIKKNLNFDILKPRAHRGATALGINARSLQGHLDQLKKAIVSPEQEIDQAELESLFNLLIRSYG